MRHFIAIGPDAWGKGNTAKQAVHQMRLRVSVGQRDYRYEVFECHPDTKVSGLGDMTWPTGYPPISLGVTNPKTSYTNSYVAPKPDPTCKAGVGLAAYAAKLAPLTTAEKLECTVTALKKIREMGYSSEASRATDTVLASINVAEDAIRTVGGDVQNKKRSKPAVRVTEAEHVRIQALAAAMRRGEVPEVKAGVTGANTLSRLAKVARRRALTPTEVKTAQDVLKGRK